MWRQGYTRNAHEGVLRATKDLLPAEHSREGFPVARNYKVEYDRARVEDGLGVWLQGCNESTHGVSKLPDTSNPFSLIYYHI